MLFSAFSTQCPSSGNTRLRGDAVAAQRGEELQALIDRHTEIELMRINLRSNDASRSRRILVWSLGMFALLQAVGYRDVTIDPRGYRTGSLNDGLVLRPA